MGRGKRIQDFRNLKMDSQTEKKEDTLFGFGNLKNGSEFVIEIEEKAKNEKKTSNTKNNTKKNNNQKTYPKKAKKNTEVTKKSPKSSKNNTSKNAKKEEKKKVSKWISIFLLTFIFVGVIAGCLVTPTFDVSSVEAIDGINVKNAEIQKYFTNVKGKNIFLVDTNAIEKEIEKHQYIYEADVSRILPNKLSVKYVERKQYAAIKYIESYVLLDKYGNVLEVIKENLNPELPIIYGMEGEDFIVGTKLEGVLSLKFENIVYLLETMSHTGFKYKVTNINYTNLDELEIEIKELDIKIKYGEVQKDLLSDKVAYLNEVLKKLEDKKGFLDISSKNYSEKVIFTEKLN